MYGSEDDRSFIRQHFNICISSRVKVDPKTKSDLKLTQVPDHEFPERVKKVTTFLSGGHDPMPWENIKNEGMDFLEAAQSWHGFLKDIEIFSETHKKETSDLDATNATDYAERYKATAKDSTTRAIIALKTSWPSGPVGFPHRDLLLGLFGIQTILQASIILKTPSEATLANYYSAMRTPLLGMRALLFQQAIHLPRPIGSETRPAYTDFNKSQYCIPDALLVAQIPELESPPFFRDFQRSKVSPRDERPFLDSASPRWKSEYKLEFISVSFEDKPYDGVSGAESWETALRQNMISTSSLLRHLRSFCIDTEVLNIVWTRWSVRASVDFCEGLPDGGVRFCSYIIPPDPNSPEKDSWDLKKPEDLKDLYRFLIRVKEWSRDVFSRKVREDLLAFMESDKRWQRWANSGEVYASPVDTSQEKIPPTPQGSKAGSMKGSGSKKHKRKQTVDKLAVEVQKKLHFKDREENV